MKKLWVESYEKEEEKSLTIWNKQEEEMKNLYDKEINEKVDCLTKKQDFDENMNLQNNMDGDQRINDRGRPPSPRPSSPRPYNRRHPSPGPALLGTNLDLSTHTEILMEVSTETTAENSTTTM